VERAEGLTALGPPFLFHLPLAVSIEFQIFIEQVIRVLGIEEQGRQPALIVIQLNRVNCSRRTSSKSITITPFVGFLLPFGHHRWRQ
jgi:hypothetical protein